MHRNTILIISILAMLLLAGSLMGFIQTINVNTNYQGEAYIEITDLNGIPYFRIPWNNGTFTIYPNSNNPNYTGYLYEGYGYVATVYAHRYVNGVTITDTDSQNFTYGTGTITLTVDLSGNGSIPDDPPAGH